MLAIVTCFFNLARFARPAANINRFLRQMRKEGVPVYGIEAKPAHYDSTVSSPTWKTVHLSREQYLWQKEAALNLAEALVPPEYDKIAWVDGDVWFESPTWVADTEAALDQFDVVQMFEKAHWTSRTGKVELSRHSVAKVPLDPHWRSHPGFAWAMRRDLWKAAGGLYPYCIAGGADTVMSLTFLNRKPWQDAANALGPNHTLWDQWTKAFEGVKTGFVPGSVYHEWHGSLQNRQYVGRRDMLKSVVHGEHVRIGANGLLEWADRAPSAAKSYCNQYFAMRKEDG